ncbi:putative amidoligase domain-containing protein [Paenibacillus nasutitermitis]|uniref:Phage phiEco32-like COOH.NH2 ligase-type 2 n=1 Tax=Paenibacillus nasutitermitis TaxID=1652958 RepID=A0A917DT28_9BACL|nr:hypothetical protein [Paenibacillus nasutitermitis]GGD64084.1 hypothetical protein GCM10010911_22280 [Paenibacillus nasutitermitis]
MSGTVWYWDGGNRMDCKPQAWIDGMPSPGDAVVVCGAARLPSSWRLEGEPLIINGGASAFSLTDPEQIRFKLEQSGVAVAALDGEEAEQANSLPLRLFTVTLFNLQPLSVTRHRPDSVLKISNSEPYTQKIAYSHHLYRPLTRLAAKALYALGLDMGLVTLHAQDAGRCEVVSVTLPQQQEVGLSPWKEAIQSFASAIARDAAMNRDARRGRILLGADPEFLLLGPSGKVVSAARYLEGGWGAGCDAVIIGGRIRYPVAELRPEPASTVIGLAANLRRLLGQAALRITDSSLRWSAGGMPVRGFALGGHIHLSGVLLSGRLLRQLDSYMAMPLAMVESSAEHARRPRYGFLGDFRMQPHGGFEYRTLPSWLHSPAAAKAVFALSLLCALESGQLSYRPAEEPEAVTAYYKGNRELLRTHYLEPLASSMAATSSYRELAVYIEPLLEAAARGKVWDVKADIRQKWRIAPYI